MEVRDGLVLLHTMGIAGLDRTEPSTLCAGRGRSLLISLRYVGKEIETRGQAVEFATTDGARSWCNEAERQCV